MNILHNLRNWYFQNVRGYFVRSYRITEVNLAEGTSHPELIRYVVEVRYWYTWYRSSDDGRCEAEKGILKPSKSLFKSRYDAGLLLFKIVTGVPFREPFEVTQLLEGQEGVLT